MANKICLYFSGPKKSPGGNSNPNRLSCNLAFKDSESQQKDLESFNTKDSSDSKSHDSGIDSIEKPGKIIGTKVLNKNFIEAKFYGFPYGRKTSKN